MQLHTTGEVTRQYTISARMLRYYEKAGLISSVRKQGYAYRVYDEENLARIGQIIVLRKLRVPLKQIDTILSNADAALTVEVFRDNIAKLDEEITALSTVRAILARFVEEINQKAAINLQLLEDEAAILSALSFTNSNLKKGGLGMEELNSANQRLDKYEDKDVRIVYLPPMTVAAVYARGEDCEGKAGAMINQFVKDTGLLSIKPDARSFGFDCSQGAVGVGEPSRVYEMWVSVPEGMDIPQPLIRREFLGGMYAAHVLTNWDFNDWNLLGQWVNESPKYANDWGAPRWESQETVFGQGFEETLNFFHYAQTGQMKDLQLDLLFPIRLKQDG